jgi:hypothetical protein
VRGTAGDEQIEPAVAIEVAPVEVGSGSSELVKVACEPVASLAVAPSADDGSALPGAPQPASSTAMYALGRRIDPSMAQRACRAKQVRPRA